MFYSVTYGELFFLSMILKFLKRDEIDLLFPFEVLIIHLSVYISVVLPLGGAKGIKDKFERKYGKDDIE